MYHQLSFFPEKILTDLIPYVQFLQIHPQTFGKIILLHCCVRRFVFVSKLNFSGGEVLRASECMAWLNMVSGNSAKRQEKLT